MPPHEDTTETQLSKEHQRLVAKLALIRQMQEGSPTTPDPSLTDQEMARRLLFDLMTTITRAEFVIQAGSDVLIDLTDTQKRAVEVKLEELHLQRHRIETALAERAAEDQKQERIWAVVAKPLGAMGAWMGAIFFDQRVISAVIGAIVILLTQFLASWGLGVGLGL